MRAVVWKGPYEVTVDEIEDPRVEESTDAVMRLTTAAICGSDLHMYEGRAPIEPGQVFGHENLGVIEEVGSAVKSVRPGDRVVLPFNIACGFCFNCARGFTNACLTVNPHSHGGGYGYSGMGPYRGGQAEKVRVPFADVNCLKLPGKPGDAFEDDFVLLADVFPTGFHATEQARVLPGDSVAIFGAGPVGLMAALSAKIRGASEIYVVDAVAERLEKAQALGATPVDFSKGDPVQQILDLRVPHRKNVQNLQRGAGDKMPGVMCAIDAVGYEAWAHDGAGKTQNPTQVLDDVVAVTNPTGHVGLIGVYFPQDPGGVDEDAKKGRFTVALGNAWEKGLSVEMGQCPVKKYNVYLRDLIVAGVAKPSVLVSHRLPLDAAPEAYRKFDERTDGYTKVLLKPQQSAA
ncbi:MAG: glutathione-independent formaldehyde dehydrogenase [Candidatus Eremiobacteraeota bacterium]|nr:glutathione-independent formaldehyde dehydrogenase [Candidatus Eremiobacteraeota bacterium]MBV8584063.1 glutathione-independent formaldehyde dehydrogenase [Candidatus Eremiobacteraeota bacterium]